jgi:hypothetical protein
VDVDKVPNKDHVGSCNVHGILAASSFPLPSADRDVIVAAVIPYRRSVVLSATCEQVPGKERGTRRPSLPRMLKRSKTGTLLMHVKTMDQGWVVQGQHRVRWE